MNPTRSRLVLGSAACVLLPALGCFSAAVRASAPKAQYVSRVAVGKGGQVLVTIQGAGNSTQVALAFVHSPATTRSGPRCSSAYYTDYRIAELAHGLQLDSGVTIVPAAGQPSGTVFLTPAGQPKFQVRNSLNDAVIRKGLGTVPSSARSRAPAQLTQDQARARNAHRGLWSGCRATRATQGRPAGREVLRQASRGAVTA